MQNLSQKYRIKAVVCEKRGSEATDSDIKFAWAEVAIEWHALAFRSAESELELVEKI
jgi:hypothetical protein